MCMGKRGSECNFPKLHIFSQILARNTNVYNRTHTGTVTTHIENNFSWPFFHSMLGVLIFCDENYGGA